jgi:hypothetical protein
MEEGTFMRFFMEKEIVEYPVTIFQRKLTALKII